MAEVSLALPDRSGQKVGLDLWEKAVQRLSETDKQCIELHADKGAVLVDLLNTVTERQQACIGKQWKYTKRNGDVVFVRDALAGVFDGIKRFQQIGDIAVQYDPTHAALPWAGVRLLLKIAINDHEMHGAMLDGVEQVSRLIVRYAIIETMYLKPSAILQDQLRDCIVELYVAVLTYLAKARSYYDRSTTARFSRAIVQSSSAVEKHLTVIYERARRVDEVVGLIEAEFTRTRARFMMEGFGSMKDGLDGIEHGLHGINDQLRGFAEKFDTLLSPSIDREKLLRWLNAVFTDEEWESSLKARTPGTCTWILDRRPFQEWAEGSEKQLLWIYGNPGFGKTVLSAYIVDHLLQFHPNRVAYFFCTSDDEAKRQPLAIVRSWVAQMINQPEVQDIVQEVQSGKEGRHTATTADVWRIFHRLCSTIEGFFVIDGLDECMDDRQITDFLADLSTASCRVLIVSRPHGELRAAFRRLSETKAIREFEILPTDTQSDINTFSASVVAARLPKKSEGLQKEMVQEASRRSQSMFLWVRLLGDRLDPTENTKELRKIVKEMPKEIEDAYAAEIRRIEATSRHRDHAISVLRWILFAQRPLTVREITEALAVEDDDGDEYPTDNLPDSWEDDGVDERIQRLCGSLITLKGRKEQTLPTEQTVHFVHFSVREYLSSRTASAMSFLAAKEHDLLAQVCLRYLCYPEIATKNNQSSKALVAQQVQTYGFLNYAAHFWCVHAHIAEWSTRLGELINSLFDPASQRWILWSKIAGDELVQSASVCKVIDAGNTHGDVPSLFYAALLGFLSPIRRLLQEDGNINQSSGAGTPLHAAVIGGHIEVVQLLLEQGADLDVQTPVTGMTPMHFAAIDGRFAISALLLAHGANAGMCNRDGIAPLQSASVYTTGEVIKFLLGQGDSENLQDKEMLTPLHYAAFGGYEDIALLLIEHGAAVSVADSDGMMPLYYAVVGGCELVGDHLSVLEVLKEHGADLNTPRHDGRTPLHAASSVGNLYFVRYLLDSGATVDARDENGATPLSLAVQTNLDVVRALVEHGADVNAKDHEQDTALHCAAAAGGTIDIVTYLLERGADLHAQDSIQRTPLHFAASSEMTKSLLNAGADLAAASGQGFTAFHFAAAFGNIEVAEVLYQFKANINALSIADTTPLHVACMQGEKSMVRWLVERGADIDARDKDGETILHHAVVANQVALVKFLVAHGADTNVLPSDQYSALHVAVNEGHAMLIDVLIDGGAKISIATDRNETPVHLAAYAGHVGIVENLLRRGADGTALDSCGRSVFDLIAEHPEVFSDLSSLPHPLPRSSPLAQKRALHNAVTNGANLLLKEQVDWRWDKLGRNLLQLSDLAAAKTCLIQAVRMVGAERKLRLLCDLCDADTEKKRFVCQTCPDVDMCASCMPKYPDTAKLPMCRSHAFFELSIPAEEERDGEEQKAVEDLMALLRDLVDRYDLDDEVMAAMTTNEVKI